MMHKYISFKILLIFVILLCSISICAQKKHKFDPAKFQADLEHFITVDAGLTPAESAIFFPVYREMRNKQWAYLGEERRLRCIDTSDDKACEEAIRKRDKNDFDMKILQQTYHERFMTLLSPSKVYRILRAEDKFHKRLFKFDKQRGETEKFR